MSQLRQPGTRALIGTAVVVVALCTVQMLVGRGSPASAVDPESLAEMLEAATRPRPQDTASSCNPRHFVSYHSSPWEQTVAAALPSRRPALASPRVLRPHPERRTHNPPAHPPGPTPVPLPAHACVQWLDNIENWQHGLRESGWSMRARRARRGGGA